MGEIDLPLKMHGLELPRLVLRGWDGEVPEVEATCARTVGVPGPLEMLVAYPDDDDARLTPPAFPESGCELGCCCRGDDDLGLESNMLR